MHQRSGWLQIRSGGEHDTSRDLELVSAAKAGSNAAFEELQTRHARRLYRRIQSITRSHEDTEDALQETFFRAYLALASFEGRSQFATWLTRIAINSALMVLRKRRVRSEVAFDLSPGADEYGERFDVQDTGLNPEQLYALRQRSECVLHAISKLNVTLRAPMMTWIEQECSMKDVARRHELSLSSVKSRLHRARKQLTCNCMLNERSSNAGSIPGLKGQRIIPDFQNRELPCLSFD
jgi:RNA polymerase sigma-70 factor (ECF subfamily)